MHRADRRSRTGSAAAELVCALLVLGCGGAAAAQVAAQGPAAAAQGAPGETLARADRELAEIEDLVATAYFRTALSVAAATRGLLEGAGGAPAVRARRARLEVLAATAELALGRDGAARQRLARALRADPGLELDAARTSPRVTALLAEARQGLAVREAAR
jgi:hypothetical protein